MQDTNAVAQGQPNIRTLRTVCVMLCLGVTLFAAIAIILTNEQRSPAFSNQALTQQATDLGRVLTPAVFVLGFAMLAAWPLLRRGHLAAGRRVWQSNQTVEARERRLFGGYSVLTILRAALAEGLGLFGVVTFFLSAQWLALLAPAAAVAIIVMTMPSRDRYKQFLASVTT